MSAFDSIAKFTADLRRLPRVVANRVASEAAPVISSLARSTFDAQQTPYRVPWRPGEDGSTPKLVESGRLLQTLRYVAIGTKLRVALGVPYAKFQIGRRPVFPTQGGKLPLEYIGALSRTAVAICRQELGR